MPPRPAPAGAPRGRALVTRKRLAYVPVGAPFVDDGAHVVQAERVRGSAPGGPGCAQRSTGHLAGRQGIAPRRGRLIEAEAFAPDDATGCVGCALRDGAPGGGAGDDRGDGGGGEGTGPTVWGTAPVRVGGLIQAPRKIRHVDPRYPDLARTAGIAGVVILECVIDRDGLVQSVQVLRGHPLLNAATVSAVRQWAYTPTRLNGVPVAVVMTVTVRFTTRR